jgi:hypothetical protein
MPVGGPRDLNDPGQARAEQCWTAGAATARPQERTDPMGRLLRYLLVLILLAAIGLVAWSYSGLLRPDRQVVTEPVDLGGD